MSFTLASPAFPAGGAIPRAHTCDGENRSVPLQWSGTPPGTQSLALIVDDPDSPDPAAPRRVWVHWVLYDIPATATSLAEGAAPDGLPQGTRRGRNDSGETGYDGPCPPIGRHRYHHRLYALDRSLGDLGHLNKPQLLHAIEGHVLAVAELMGTYQRGH